MQCLRNSDMTSVANVRFHPVIMYIHIEHTIETHLNLEALENCSCDASYTWLTILREEKKDNYGVLVKPLYESFEVIVQDSAFLRLYRAK